MEVEGDLAEVQLADHHRGLGDERPAADGGRQGDERMGADEGQQRLAILEPERPGRMHQPAARSRATGRARVSPSATPSKRVCSQWRWKAATTVSVHSSYWPDGAQL